MKQIFEWLRDYIYRNSYKNDVEVITQEDALAMVDEAEAKWESDCCEQWDIQKYATFVPIHSIFYHVDESKYWKFCPHCGKPIKIVEVE